MHAAPGAHDLHDEGVMEDLTEYVWGIVRNVAQNHGLEASLGHSLAADIRASFTDVLVNLYGED